MGIPADSRIVVYTAIFGGYDNLIQPQKRAVNCKAEYLYYTDNVQMPGGTWRCILHLDNTQYPVQVNRMFKCGMKHHTCDWSIYIDGHMRLNCDPFDIINDLIAKYGERDCYVTQHPHGPAHTIAEEAQWVIGNGLAFANEICNQTGRYFIQGMPGDLHAPQCGFLVRYNCTTVRAFNEIWMNEVMDYSYRDQVSFPYAAWKTKLDYVAIRRKDRFHYVTVTDHIKQRRTFQ